MLWQSILRNLGPSLITAALIFGPGSLTVATKLGAGYGYQLIWVIVLSVIFMIAYTQLSSQIGLNIDHSLLQEIRQKYGKYSAAALGFGIFAICCSFQAGNSIGAGVSMFELTGASINAWIAIICISAIFLLFFKSFYRILEKIMIGLVFIMLSSFLITVLVSGISWSQLFSGFIPSIPAGSEILSIAIVASSFSIVGAFYQSSLVKEKGWTRENLSLAMGESVVGIITLGFLSSLVLICASSVLFRQNIEVNAATDLALALEPLFGKFSATIFMIGFLAASYSSLIGNATIGGALLADGLNLGSGLQHMKVRIAIIFVILVGGVVAMIFGTLPLELIVFAQALTILIAPAAAVSMLLIGYQKNIVLQRFDIRSIMLMAGCILLIILAIYNFYRIFLT